MTSSSSPVQVERVQPWLGTFVKVGIVGLPLAESHRAIDVAFKAIARVHGSMSFHAWQSDVSRLNRAARGQFVTVEPYTFSVLREAMNISAQTRGLFDVTVGAELSRWNHLPRRPGIDIGSEASWEDLELLEGNCVRLRKRVCIDLGGIAKGFAVDLATEIIREHGAERAWVNAGGDIGISGRGPDRILLDSEEAEDNCLIIDIEDGSIASSLGHQSDGSDFGSLSPHVNGRTRRPASQGRFVSVLHPRCLVADALTKVVMLLGAESAPILRMYGASALMHERGNGWSSIAGEGVPA